MEEVLEEPELRVPSDERWLELVAPPRAATPGHDPKRVVRRNR